MAAYQVGDKVRVVRVPPSLYTVVDRDTGQVYEETVQLFELAVGRVFRIEDFDDHGSLELWVTDEGEQAVSRFFQNRFSHTIWIEPEYVERADEADLSAPKDNHEFISGGDIDGSWADRVCHHRRDRRPKEDGRKSARGAQ